MRQSKPSLIRHYLLALCIGVMAVSAVAQRGGVRGPVKGVQPQAQKRELRKIPQHQADALEQAKREGMGVVWGEQMQSPLSVRAKDLGEPRVFSAAGRRLQVRKGAPWEENAIAVMDNLSPLFGVGDAQEEFDVKRVDADKIGFHHVRLTQRYRGLPVFGTELVVHFDAAGLAYEVNGEYAPGIDLDVKPGIAAEAALQIVRDDQAVIGVAAVEVQQAPDLVIYAYGGSEPRLAYEMTVSYRRDADGMPGSWRYWVDAKTGEVLQKYNDVKLIAPPTAAGELAMVSGSRLTGEDGSTVEVEGWLEDGAYYLYNPEMAWLVYNVSSSLAYSDAATYAFRMTDDWAASDRTEMSAAYNINATQRYYREVHGRYSYDNNNTVVRVNVHAGNFANAYWEGGNVREITIGDGDNFSSTSLAVLDVMAHEFQHAVTEHTTDLVYMNESGALNESFSDIFAACVEFYTQPDGRGAYPVSFGGLADWLIGEDCWISGLALRDMRNPRSLFIGSTQPSRYLGTDWWTDADDNGGVHANSGPMNFFFYLLCDGGEGNNDGLPYAVEGIGIEQAEQIAFRVLTVYCTRNSGYAAVREAWFSAVRDLFPLSLASVRHAWDAVMGVQDPPGFYSQDILPDGRIGNPYYFTFVSTGPSPAYAWSHVGGDLPLGFVLSPDGRLTCLPPPTQVETCTFLVAVEANNGLISTNAFTLTIRPPLEAPFSENFEGEMEGPQTGWMQEAVDNIYLWTIRTGSPSGRPGSTHSGNGTNNAYLGIWNDSGTTVRPHYTARLISPMIVFGPAPRAARLTFYMFMEPRLTWQDELRVYCKEHWGDPWGEPLAVYTSPIASWTKQTIDLPIPRPGQTMYIAFEGSAKSGWGVCVDAVCLEDPIPPLAIITPPLLPTATVGTNYPALTQLESEGGWSDDPGEYTYAVIDGALPDGWGLTPEGVVTGCSYLVETCTFVVEVTDSMGNQAQKTMVLKVEQPRAPIYADDFEVKGPGTDLPAGWTQEYVQNTVNWQYVTGRVPPMPPFAAHSGYGYALFFSPQAQGFGELISKLVSPEIDLSQAPNNTRLSFYHFMQKWSGQDELRVYYRNTKSAAWTLLETYKSEVTEWTERVIELPNLSATYQIAFEGRARSGYGVAIDTVRITDDAAAPIITTLKVLPGGFTGFAYHTALQAVGGAPDYTWGLVDGTLPAGLTLNASTGAISGVPASDGTSAFRVFVMGSDGLASTNAFSIRILRPGKIPFTETFVGPGLPEGWSLEKVKGFGPVDWVFCSGTISTHPGAKPLKAPTGTSSNACFWTLNDGETIARLISPPINLSNTTNTVLMFQLCMGSYLKANEHLSVRYRTNTVDNWVTLATYTEPIEEWTPQMLELPNPSSTYYIAFEGSSLGYKGYGVCVGDIYASGDIVDTDSGFEAWRKEHFNESELLDPGISGPDADPDGDGIPNLMEYAMGLNPRGYDEVKYVCGGLTNLVSNAAAPDGNYLYLRYRRKNELPADVKFTVLGTPSLTPPELNWLPDDICELAPWVPGDEPDLWSWVYNIHLTPSTNAPQRFLKLRVELQ